MAEQALGMNRGAKGRTLTMRALWRLALWGTTAAVALAVVVLAGTSDIGAQRLRLALAAIGKVSSGGWFETATPQQTRPSPEQLASRAVERVAAAEQQTRQLAANVQLLTTDRDRLLTRVAVLERSLDDVTGSVRRQAERARAAAVPASPVTTAAAHALESPHPQSIATVPFARPPIVTAPASRPAAASDEDSDSRESRAATPANDRDADKATASAEDSEPRTEFGVDLGGATSFAGLRARWNAAKKIQPELLEALEPLVFVRERRRNRSVELRLIAGPLADAGAAARVCATFASIGRYCQPTVYDGQRLALR